MSDPGFTRSDSCSIRAADRQAEPADAVRGLLSSDGDPLGGDDPLDPLARGAARIIFEGWRPARIRVPGPAGRHRERVPQDQLSRSADGAAL